MPRQFNWPPKFLRTDSTMIGTDYLIIVSQHCNSYMLLVNTIEKYSRIIFTTCNLIKKLPSSWCPAGDMTLSRRAKSNEN